MSFTERFLFLIVVICFIQITVKSRYRNSAIMRPNHRLLGTEQEPVNALGWYLNKSDDDNKYLTMVLDPRPSRALESSSAHVPTRTGRRKRFRQGRSVTKQLSTEAIPSKAKSEPIKKVAKTKSSPYTAFFQDSELNEHTNKKQGNKIKPTRTTKIISRPVFEKKSSLKHSFVNKTEVLPSAPSQNVEDKKKNNIILDASKLWKGPFRPWFSVDKEHMPDFGHGSAIGFEAEYNSQYQP